MKLRDKKNILFNSKLKVFLLLLSVCFSTISKATVTPHVTKINSEVNHLVKFKAKQPSLLSQSQNIQNLFFEFDIENEEDDDDKTQFHFIQSKAFESFYTENKFEVAHKLYCQSHIPYKAVPFYILYQNRKVFS